MSFTLGSPVTGDSIALLQSQKLGLLCHSNRCATIGDLLYLSGPQRDNMVNQLVLLPAVAFNEKSCWFV